MIKFILLIVMLLGCNKEELSVFSINTDFDIRIRERARSSEYLIVTKKFNRPKAKNFYIEHYLNSIFFLYFNKFKLSDCKKNFLLQRVKKVKTIYVNGQIITKDFYKVEAFKVGKGETILVDEHKTGFTIDNYDKKVVTTNLEYGCGYLKSDPSGTIQQEYTNLNQSGKKYDITPVDYNDVVFIKSKKYSHSVSLSRDKKCHFKLPDFILQEVSKDQSKEYISKSGCLLKNDERQ